MADTSEQVQLLIDRLEVDDLLTCYTIAPTRASGTSWPRSSRRTPPSTTPPARASRGSTRRSGSGSKKALTAFTASQHLLGNRQIELDGDHGTGRTYFFNPNTLTDAAGAATMLFVGGFYVDKFVRTAEGWRIEDRDEQTTWVNSEEPLDSIVARLGNS